MKKIIYCIIFSSVILLNSCSLNRLVIGQMSPILENSSAALFEESDLELAEQALASNLKLLEGLLKSDPQNERLLQLAAQGYAGYALGFVEDENPERAKVMYLRARDYGLRLLQKSNNFAQAEKEGLEALAGLVKSYDKNDLPGLFWTGFSWAGYINLSLDKPSALLDLPKVQLIMERVEELDSSYFNGAVYLYFGSIYGMKPKIMGGDPEKAKQYFDKNLQITENKFLLTYIYMAKYYAAKILDESLFDQYLAYVENASIDVLPGMELLNQIAKRKAVYLKKMKEDLF